MPVSSIAPHPPPRAAPLPREPRHDRVEALGRHPLDPNPVTTKRRRAVHRDASSGTARLAGGKINPRTGTFSAAAARSMPESGRRRRRGAARETSSSAFRHHHISLLSAVLESRDLGYTGAAALCETRRTVQ